MVPGYQQLSSGLPRSFRGIPHQSLYYAGPSERIWKWVGGGGGGGGKVLTGPNCKLFTCQLVIVAAAPVLQDFHPDEKVCVCVGGGRFLRP